MKKHKQNVKKRKQIIAFAATKIDGALYDHFLNSFKLYTWDVLVGKLSKHLLRETCGSVGDVVSLEIGGEDHDEGL